MSTYYKENDGCRVCNNVKVMENLGKNNLSDNKNPSRH